MKARGTFADAPAEPRAYWLALHADVLGRARDFDNAEKWLAQAEALLSTDPWVHVERAALCAREDREDEAMQAARRALDVRPWSRPAVQWLAHFLVQKECDDEALHLLQEASRRLESYAVLSQLVELQLELGHYALARDNLEECARLTPLGDAHTRDWLASRRSEAAYHCADLEGSRAWAQQVTHSRFYEVQAQRLEHPPADCKRVCLPVGFVRQHHVTCAPATLAALCRYWSMPGDHLEVAAAITYAGTPNHSERQWAIDHGWYTKEFTVTWDSARRVLDQGVPFTLSTLEVSSAHLQAIIGYDELRGTLILRDPGDRHQSELIAEGLDRYRSSGPRGMAMVPMADKARLATLELPDAEPFDHLFQLERALEAHDRDRAERWYRALRTGFPEHRLTILAERILAGYDVDAARILSATEKMLQLFPDDPRWQLAKTSCLRNLARRGEFLDLLGHLSSQPESDPACWEQYAWEIAGDARQHDWAERLLERAMAFPSVSARAYHSLARICSAQRRFAEAIELYRLAACMEDTDDYLARAYFEAAQSLGRTDEALDFLQRRFDRFGTKSGQPARTLAWAYFQLERTGEGFAVLAQAMALRPDDGELMLAAIDRFVERGDFPRARALAVRAAQVAPQRLAAIGGQPGGGAGRSEDGAQALGTRARGSAARGRRPPSLHPLARGNRQPRGGAGASPRCLCPLSTPLPARAVAARLGGRGRSRGNRGNRAPAT